MITKPPEVIYLQWADVDSEEGATWSDDAINDDDIKYIRADNDTTMALVEEVRRLQATLDGDPHQIATPEQRREWRLSAIRYADKVEAERDTLREWKGAIETLVQNMYRCPFCLVWHNNDKGIIIHDPTCPMQTPEVER